MIISPPFLPPIDADSTKEDPLMEALDKMTDSSCLYPVAFDEAGRAKEYQVAVTARVTLKELPDEKTLWENPAYLAGALQYLADTKKHKNIAVMMPYSQALKDVADWVERYRRFWEQSFDRLDDYLRKLQTKEKKHARKQRKS